MKPDTTSLERPALLAEAAADTAHYYWPSEFPIALCGYLSQHPSLEVKTRLLGPLCEPCACHAAAAPVSGRINPHRHGG